jgi:hypothetical protein
MGQKQTFAPQKGMSALIVAFCDAGYEVPRRVGDHAACEGNAHELAM